MLYPGGREPCVAPTSGYENGALWFRLTEGRMRRRWMQDAEQRRANRQKLASIGEEILREVAGAAISADQFSRECDLAIDFREDVPPLPRQAVDRIVSIFESNGCTAKVSSIHVNGWLGKWDKRSMLGDLLRSEFGIILGHEAKVLGRMGCAAVKRR